MSTNNQHLESYVNEIASRHGKGVDLRKAKSTYYQQDHLFQKGVRIYTNIYLHSKVRVETPCIITEEATSKVHCILPDGRYVQAAKPKNFKATLPAVATLTHTENNHDLELYTSAVGLESWEDACRDYWGYCIQTDSRISKTMITKEILVQERAIELHVLRAEIHF
jgi:hypothetical protein